MIVGFIIENLDMNWQKIFIKLNEDFPEHNFINTVNHDPKFIIEQSDVLVLYAISEEELNHAKKLKVIFTPFAGVDSLPLELIKKLNIQLSNTHWNAKYVAEKALGLALSVMGRTVEFHKRLEKGLWSGYLTKNEQYQNWTSLYDKSCTILGFGAIGKAIVRLLAPYECSIKAFKRKINKNDLKYNVKFTTDLKDALTDSDVCFNTLPLTNETRHLINSSNINLLYDSFVINVGRGSVIEEKSFFEALKSGAIKGAGIDVWYCYPNNLSACLPSLYPFHELSNVVISPHVASESYEGLDLFVNSTIDRIRTYLSTGKIINQVIHNQGY